MERAILLTGATGGIGAAIAHALSRPEHWLLMAGRRQDVLDGLLEQVGGATMAGDLSDPAYVRSLIDALRRAQGYPVLVQCAGLARFGDFAEMPWADIEEQAATNMLGAMRLAHAFVPLALERGGGQIVDVLSVASVRCFPNSEAYCASKAGMLAFDRCLAASYRRRGLRVTSLLPGAVDTPLWDANGNPDPSKMLTPAAVAKAVADLVEMPFDRNVDEVLLMPPGGTID